MKQILLAVVVFIVRCSISVAQGEQYIWTFGNSYTLDFNTIPPTLIDGPITSLPAGIFNEQSITVSDDNGNRLFTVRKSWSVNSDIDDIYDRNGDPIPGTALLTQSGVGFKEQQMPTVVPHPRNPYQYYIFYGRNNGLLYSLFDISLNGGLGQVVSGRHNVLVAGYNTVSCDAMTTIRGCTGVWLIVREKLGTGYLSYKIDHNGLEPVPIRSDPNTLPPAHFQNIRTIKASPDGKIVAAVWPALYDVTDNSYIKGGLLLYDFEPCSGKLRNERILDDQKGYGGVCFSPDNSKLYVSQNDTVYSVDHLLGSLYQYDLSFPLLEDIRQSKTLIYSNPIAIEYRILCPPAYRPLGDLKIGPDEKIYQLNNNPAECPNTGPGMAFHIIHQPNNAGLACQPEINALYNAPNGMYSDYGRYRAIDLQREIIVGPIFPPDTVLGAVTHISACFEESVVLEAPAGKSCYKWFDGSDEQQITVSKPGIFWLSYYTNCSFQTDTFYVEFLPVPEIPDRLYGCDGDIAIKIGNPLSYHIELFKDHGSNKIASGNGPDFTVNGLSAGIYQLKTGVNGGCDTTFEIQLLSYPLPVLSVSPEDTTIKYGDAIRLSVEGAKLYTWWPRSSLDTPISNNPIAKPYQPTIYTVTGMNDYGCRDTAQVSVNINYSIADLVPNSFTPNGDGLNDIFRIEGITFQQIRTFEIYNRYGELVHAEYYSNNGWDGSFKGQPCDAGTYYFIIRIDNPNGQERALKGDIHLIR